MVATCANPLCGAPFRYLRTGKLFMVYGWRPNMEASGEKLVPKTERQSEYFWLCERCASKLTIDVNQGALAILEPATSPGRRQG